MVSAIFSFFPKQISQTGFWQREVVIAKRAVDENFCPHSFLLWIIPCNGSIWVVNDDSHGRFQLPSAFAGFFFLDYAAGSAAGPARS